MGGGKVEKGIGHHRPKDSFLPPSAITGGWRLHRPFPYIMWGLWRQSSHSDGRLRGKGRRGPVGHLPRHFPINGEYLFLISLRTGERSASFKRGGRKGEGLQDPLILSSFQGREDPFLAVGPWAIWMGLLPSQHSTKKKVRVLCGEKSRGSSPTATNPQHCGGALLRERPVDQPFPHQHQQ